MNTFIIPKNFDDDWKRMIKYVEELNKLKINYNSKKALFPRLETTNKRGRIASIEIMNKLKCFFLSKNNWLEELCFCLRNKIQIKKANNHKIIYFDNLPNDQQFLFSEFNIYNNLNDVKNKIEQMMITMTIQQEDINPLEYIKQHLENIELSNEQKVELVNFIINL